MTRNFHKIRELEATLMNERNNRVVAQRKMNAKDTELKLVKMDYDALLRVKQDMAVVDRRQGDADFSKYYTDEAEL